MSIKIKLKSIAKSPVIVKMSITVEIGVFLPPTTTVSMKYVMKRKTLVTDYDALYISQWEHGN